MSTLIITCDRTLSTTISSRFNKYFHSWLTKSVGPYLRVFLNISLIGSETYAEYSSRLSIHRKNERVLIANLNAIIHMNNNTLITSFMIPKSLLIRVLIENCFTLLPIRNDVYFQ